MTIKSRKKSYSDGENIGILLRKLADLIERSTADEINILLRGNSELRIYKDDLESRAVSSKRDDSNFDMTLSQVTEKLCALQTREAGSDLLHTEFPTKVSIEKLARFLDLPVNRTDTFSTLCVKIVESQIGSRLRSEAVQGKK